jgi:hypothetical protein
MRVHNLEKFSKGWFIGDFEPSLFKTSDFEVSVKRYNKGDEEDSHHHKIATEWTAIIEGSVQMNDQVFHKNHIIEVPPGTSVKFKALENVVTVVVKIPSVKGDKYL